MPGKRAAILAAEDRRRGQVLNTLRADREVVNGDDEAWLNGRPQSLARGAPIAHQRSTAGDWRAPDELSDLRLRRP
jgi:hypothetical protein